MNSTFKIAKYQIRNALRSKWLILYSLFFFLISYALLSLAGGFEHALISLMNLILFVVPLTALLYTIIYVYNSRDFIVLLLSQPIHRRTLYNGLYIGIALPLTSAFTIGMTIPFLIIANSGWLNSLILLLAIGSALTLIFLAIALILSIWFEEHIKGFGLALFFWLFLSVVYDGLILLFIYIFAAYPLEKSLIGLILINPMDLGRLILLIHFNISAMLGYTGAVFKQFFGSELGTIISVSALLTWIIIPYLYGARLFAKKDF